MLYILTVDRNWTGGSRCICLRSSEKLPGYRR